MNKITVGESALKVVVGEKKIEGKLGNMVAGQNTPNRDIGWNESIDKTLSTPLPDVNDCVEIDVEKIATVGLTAPYKPHSKKWWEWVATRGVLKWKEQ